MFDGDRSSYIRLLLETNLQDDPQVHWPLLKNRQTGLGSVSSGLASPSSDNSPSSNSSSPFSSCKAPLKKNQMKRSRKHDAVVIHRYDEILTCCCCCCLSVDWTDDDVLTPTSPFSTLLSVSSASKSNCSESSIIVRSVFSPSSFPF